MHTQAEVKKYYTVSVAMDEGLSLHIRVLAAQADQSRSEWIRDAIEERLERMGMQYAPAAAQEAE